MTITAEELRVALAGELLANGETKLAEVYKLALTGIEAAFVPQFNCDYSQQEDLAIQFCMEIAGRKGEKGSLPDPVRLLEMAEALYHAERDAALALAGGEKS